MHEDLSRLLGLEEFSVTAFHEWGDELDLEVELIPAAGCCPRCGRASVEVKERPVVRVRDSPVAGRRTYLRWRKRRFRCQLCGSSFSESHPQLPARQRVTQRFRAHLFARSRGGGAHAEVAREEETTRYQVERAFRLGAEAELGARPDPPPTCGCINSAPRQLGGF